MFRYIIFYTSAAIMRTDVHPETQRATRTAQLPSLTANLHTKIPVFRGFDSNIILILRAWILMSIGNFPESLSQAILAGRFLVGRLGVSAWFLIMLISIIITTIMYDMIWYYMILYDSITCVYIYIYIYIYIYCSDLPRAASASPPSTV